MGDIGHAYFVRLTVLVLVLLAVQVGRGDSHQPFNSLFLELIIQSQVNFHAVYIWLDLQLIDCIESFQDKFAKSSRNFVIAPAQMAD